MLICSDAHIIGKFCVSDDVFMRLLKSRSYICGGESAKSMKFPTDSSSVSLSLYREFLFRTVKVE